MDVPGRVLAELEARGAAGVDHPGGDLLSHPIRTERLFESWGAWRVLALAGLCHAAYGTDGLPVELYSIAERAELAELIGEEAESIVYQYASCDRDVVHPQLGQPSVSLRDRFTGAMAELGRDGLADFAEVTFANELDLVSYGPEFAAANAEGISALLRPCRGMVTEAAWSSFSALLGSVPAPGRR